MRASRHQIFFIARDFLIPHVTKGALFPHEKRIFPMTKKAFKQTWEKIKTKSGISDLTFHDLRHEAGSRFDELGLTKGEHDLMMGHQNRDMASRYTHTEEMKLMAIQEKLDKKWMEDFKETEARFALGLPLEGSHPSTDPELRDGFIAVYSAAVEQLGKNK